MSDFEKFRDKVLARNPDVKAEYDRLAPRYAAIADIIRLRLERGLTQADLAERIGKQQPAIARLEGGGVQPSIAFLTAVAEALDARLVLRIEEKDGGKKRAS